MISTSNIQIENLENITEYSFNTLVGEGLVSGKYMVSVEYDEIEEVFKMIDWNSKGKDKEFTDNITANLEAIRLINKYKKSVTFS